LPDPPKVILRLLRGESAYRTNLWAAGHRWGLISAIVLAGFSAAATLTESAILQYLHANGLQPDLFEGEQNSTDNILSPDDDGQRLSAARSGAGNLARRLRPL